MATLRETITAEVEKLKAEVSAKQAEIAQLEGHFETFKGWLEHEASAVKDAIHATLARLGL